MDTGARRLGPAVGQVPFVPGVEGAGRVSALGQGVTEFAVGDRVAWVYAYGSYAEQVVMPAASAVPVPDDVTDEVAASVMMQGSRSPARSQPRQRHVHAENVRLVSQPCTVMHAGQCTGSRTSTTSGAVVRLTATVTATAATTRTRRHTSTTV
jgi:hypothetical protein